MAENIYNAFTRQVPSGVVQSQRSANHPLAGLSFAAKDNIHIESWPLTCGTKTALIKSCAKDAQVVAQLKTLGANFIGSTNMDELGLTMSGFNPHFGDVPNPTNPALICGGSSSGSAAAVAGSLCAFAIGTDFGGSLRFPAAACGLVGLKLTGHILTDGVDLLDTDFDSIGIIAKSTQTIKQVLEGLIPSDRPYLAKSIVLTAVDSAVDSKIASSFKECISQLDGNVSSLALDFRETHQAWKVLGIIKIKSYLLSLPPQLPLPPMAMALLGFADKIQAEQITYAEKIVTQIKASLGSRLSSGAILVTPLLANPIPSVEQAHTSSSFGDQFFLTLANLLGLPSLTIPTKYGPLLLTGHTFSEFELLRVASQIVNPV